MEFTIFIERFSVHLVKILNWTFINPDAV